MKYYTNMLRIQSLKHYNLQSCVSFKIYIFFNLSYLKTITCFTILSYSGNEMLSYSDEGQNVASKRQHTVSQITYICHVPSCKL